MPGQKKRERERWRPGNRAAGVFKCGGKAGVIRGLLRLSLAEREESNGEEFASVEQSKETKDSPRAGWLEFVS